MMPLTFRDATNNDLAFILGVVQLDSVTPAEMPDPNSPAYQAALASITADPNQALYIAQLGGERVGTFQLTFIDSIGLQGTCRGLVEGVHVAPHHRNRGYGAEMMRFAIERCRERGCYLVQLTSNKARKDAHRFYERLGFVASHEGFKLKL
jgi:GNAT superfamily N-acetyltransferase